MQDVLTQEVIKQLGIDKDSREVQEELISMLGENILQRIVIEVAKMLPEEKRPEFDRFFGSGDLDGLRNFLEPHIPNLDRFLKNAAIVEYEATKTRAERIMQGIENE